ncbi:zinc-ribbon domain-containing protein [Paenibacillus sp. FSL R7-0189]|uniref:zinc-ribbon domain-containing protein n=1 Tax=Paenibacillus sp. FSL R7-0189 TaxID=2921673 RepID=UPI0030D802AA
MEITVTSRNVKHYESYGYVVPRRQTRDGYSFEMGQKILVMSSHLTPGSHTKVVKVCDICGKETPNRNFKDVLQSRKDGIDRCKICGSSIKSRMVAAERAQRGNNLERLFPELAREWDFESNNGLVPSQITPGSHFKASWIGAECGHTWVSSVYCRTAGTGCPFCRVSRGERKVRRQLERLKLTFEEQKSFEGLTGVKGNPLLFDFAIVREGETVCLIEYDGEQHFRPVDFAGLSKDLASRRFVALKEHDRRKDEWCKKRGIPIVRISYWGMDSIPLIIYAIAINLTNKEAA